MAEDFHVGFILLYPEEAKGPLMKRADELLASAAAAKIIEEEKQILAGGNSKKGSKRSIADIQAELAEAKKDEAAAAPGWKRARVSPAVGTTTKE